MHLLLGSHLEALAFRYTAALAGSTWTWLVVAFAVLGLWRVRIVGSIPIKAQPQPQPEFPPQKPKPKPAPRTGSAGPAESKLVPLPSCHVEDMGSCSATKGRFTAYFHVEDNGDGWEREEDEAAEEVEAVREKQTPSTWVWERRWAKLRTSGDLEWYRHVDLTALDGSVVRLWDFNGGLRRRM